MARRGERIGDAYVRIHADGGGMDDDMAKVFDSKKFGDQGDEAAAAFWEGYAARAKKERERTNKDLYDDVDRGFGRAYARAERLTDNFYRNLRTRIRRFAPDLDIGDRIYESIRESLESGRLDRLDLDESFFARNAQQMAHRARKEIEREWGQMLDEAYRMNTDFDLKLRQDRDRDFEHFARNLRERAEAWEDLLDEAYRMNSDFDAKLRMDRDRDFELWARDLADRQRLHEEYYRNLSENQDQEMRSRIANISNLRAESDRLREAVARMAAGNAQWSDSSKELNRDLRRLRAQLPDLVDANGDALRVQRELREEYARTRLQLILLSPRLADVNRRFNGIADTIGRMTGRGSRNNFLNFVGSLNRNIVRLVNTLTIGTARAATGVFKLAHNWRAFADPDLLKQLASNMATFFANFGTNVIALAGAFVVVAGVASAFTAALSGLLGIITALTASLSFGLLGALAAVAGVLAPMAFSVGAIAAAWAALDDEQKKALQTDLKPLTNAFQDLGEAVGDVLFRDVGQWARQLAPLVERVTPIFTKVARSIRTTVGEAIDGLTSSPGARRFFDTMERTMPRAVESLGRIFNDTFGGLAGVFRAIASPGGILERFLGWLERITAEFSEWANSRRGQRELIRFFEDAGDSAAAVGDFLGELTGALAELFSQTREGGDSLFRAMADDLARFQEWLTSPEGQQAVQDWIEYAKDFADELGDLGGSLRDLWDALDNEQAREFVIDMVDLLARLVGWLSQIDSSTFTSLVPGGAVMNVWNGLKEIWEGLPGALQQVLAPGRAVRDIFSAIGRFKMPSIEDVFKVVLGPSRVFLGLLERIRRNARLPSVDNIFKVVLGPSRVFLGLLANIGRTILRIPVVKNVVQAVVKAVTGFIDLLQSIPGLIRRVPNIDDISNAAEKGVQALRDLIGDLPGKIRDIPVIGGIAATAISGVQALLDLIGRVKAAVASALTLRINVSVPDPGGGIPFVPGVATGGWFGRITNGPMLRWVGEDGAEAIVPLEKPLHEVDPSVRWLAAIAQGKSPLTTADGNGGRGDRPAPNITVVTPSEDPFAVAHEVFNTVTGGGY